MLWLLLLPIVADAYRCYTVVKFEQMTLCKTNVTVYINDSPTVMINNIMLVPDCYVFTVYTGMFDANCYYEIICNNETIQLSEKTYMISETIIVLAVTIVLLPLVLFGPEIGFVCIVWLCIRLCMVVTGYTQLPEYIEYQSPYKKLKPTAPYRDCAIITAD